MSGLNKGDERKLIKLMQDVCPNCGDTGQTSYEEKYDLKDGNLNIRTECSNCGAEYDVDFEAFLFERID